MSSQTYTIVLQLNDLCLDFEDTGNSMHYKVLFKASFKKIGINTVSLKEKSVLFLSFFFLLERTAF